MYKKIITLSLFALLLTLTAAAPVFAVTATAAATPTTDKTQLEDLKDRLATKVAALRDVVKRAVFGTVTSISISSATIETKTKTMKIEINDDVKVAQIISGKRTQLSVDDIEKDDPLTVFGTYDTTLDLLKAQFIFIESSTAFEHIAGTVTAVDRTEFTITLATPEGRNLTIDIEKSTKATQWDKTNGVVKGGFSKVAVGDTLHIVGTAVPKKENRISATRFLNLGNLSGTPSPTITVAPTAEASGTAAPKATSKPSPTP